MAELLIVLQINNSILINCYLSQNLNQVLVFDKLRQLQLYFNFLW